MRGIPVLALALLAGCAGGDGEPLEFSLVETCVPVRAATEQVFASQDAWRAFYTGNGGKGSPPAVDFSRFLLAARFDGPGSACVGFGVERVELGGDRIDVHATRFAPNVPCIAILAYPQVAVAIEARERPVRWVIRDSPASPPVPSRGCF
jgi:hypothetical protein